MTKVTNIFTNQRMDSDTSYPYVDNKSYVHLLNMRPSGYGENGKLCFLKGSEEIADYSEGGTMESVRMFQGDNDKLYNFIARADGFSRIVETDVKTRVSKVIIEDFVHLRFDVFRWTNGVRKEVPDYLNSVNQIGDYLVFSSEFWQFPRVVDIKKSAVYALGFTSEDINLNKKPPFFAPTITSKTYDSTIENDLIKDKFISFAYRYKYNDGSYSSLSFYTDTTFEPKLNGFLIDSSRKNKAMENANNVVTLSVNSGNKNVTDVEVYAREHGSNTAYLIYKANKYDLGIANNYTIIGITYKYSKNYTVLDERATNMLNSNTPMFPKAQDAAGRRLLYANFKEAFDLKDVDGNPVNIDYEVKKIQQDFNEDEDNKTAVSLFQYKVAPIFLEDYNISTTALLPTNQTKSEVEVGFADRLKINKFQVEFDANFKPPAFATKMKFVVKADKLTYEILYITYIKKIGKYTYLNLTNDNSSRVKKNDTLIIISEDATSYHEIIVEDVLNLGISDGLDLPGLYAKIKDDNNYINPVQNGNNISETYREQVMPDTIGSEYENNVMGIDFMFGSSDSRRFDATSGYDGINTVEGWYYTSLNNRGHLLKSDFGQIKEGDVLKLTINFEYMWKKSGGTFHTNGLGNIFFSKELYASRNYTDIFDFLDAEYDEPLIDLKEDGDYVWFLTNYMYPNHVKNSGIAAYGWEPNDGGGGNASEALAVKPTTTVNLIRGIDPIIFRTKNLDIENSEGLYFETSKTYSIVNNQIVPDDVSGGKMIFDINFYNGYCWGNGIESYKIRDEFNGKSLLNNFRPTAFDVNGYSSVEKSNDITYSGLYNQEMKLNELPIFNSTLVNWKSLPTEYGEITKIISTDGNIKVFCIDKVINQYYGKSVIADLQGNENVALSDEVLSGYYPLPYDFGCQHPESVVYANNLIHWIDAKRTRALANADKEIIELNSDETTFLQEGVDIIKEHKTFPSTYDYRLGDYIIGLDHNKTVVFNISQKGFSHYYNHEFDSKLGMVGRFFTTYKGVLYEDEVTENYNDFAGQGNFKAQVKFVVNPEMVSDKIFNAIYIQSNTAWNTAVKTNLTATQFSENVYEKRESYYYTEIFRDSSTKLGVVGVGRIQQINGLELFFYNPISNQVTQNDTLINEAGTVNIAITSISGKTISVASTEGLNVGDFVGVQKGQVGNFRPNGVPIRGENMEVTLTKSGNLPYYITSVSTNLTGSSPT